MTAEREPPAAIDEPWLRSALGGPDALPARAGSRWRSVLVWTSGVLLVLDIGLLLFALSFADVTAEGPAKRGLRQAVAIVTEVDAYLDAQFEALRQEAAEQQDQPLALADFPVAVTFSADEVLTHDRDEFRALLLTRSADRIYEEGMSAFQDDQEADVPSLSLQGAVRGGMDLLREPPHRAFTVSTIALAAVAGVLALCVVLGSRGYAGVLGLGVSVLVASAPFLILATAVRFAFRVAADGLDDSLAREFLELGQELTWAPIRNGIIFTVGGASLLALGLALTRWDQGRRRL